MKKTNSKSAFLIVCASLVSLAAVIIKCVQLLYYTDVSSGYIINSGKNLIISFYICIGTGFLLFAGASFAFFDKSADDCGFSPGRGMFLPCVLCAAGMFFDFIYQCVGCYEYISKNSYPAANRYVPMIACAVFALLSCVYFIVLSQSSRSNRFDFGKLTLLRLMPFFWVLCNALLGLTEYGDMYYGAESTLKYIALIFGLVFFFLLAAEKEKTYRRLGALVFFGYSYGALCFALSVPRIISFLAGAELPAAEFSAPTFLFTGIFSFAAALNISFKKKV